MNADNVNKKNQNYCEFGSLVQLQTRIPLAAGEKT